MKLKAEDGDCSDLYLRLMCVEFWNECGERWSKVLVLDGLVLGGGVGCYVVCTKRW